MSRSSLSMYLAWAKLQLILFNLPNKLFLSNRLLRIPYLNESFQTMIEIEKSKESSKWSFVGGGRNLSRSRGSCRVWSCHGRSCPRTVKTRVSIVLKKSHHINVWAAFFDRFATCFKKSIKLKTDTFDHLWRNFGQKYQ